MGCGNSKTRRQNRLLSSNFSPFVQINSEELSDKYEIGQQIGSGAYSQVYYALNKENQEPRAIKFLYKQDNINTYSRELQILNALDHPNIIRLYEIYEDEHYFFIVTEYCGGGELLDRLINNNLVSEQNASFIMKQLFSGLSYCHSKGVIHRDIKPENLLLVSQQDLTVKIIDFGTSILRQERGQNSKKLLGTLPYLAPEVIKGKFDEKCDMWSAGVIMYILLCGWMPFGGLDEEQIKNSILQGKYSLEGQIWDQISLQAKDLLIKLLTYNPSQRITAQQAFNHEWTQHRQQEQNLKPKVFHQALRNLKTFRLENKIQRAVLAFIASQLVTQQDRQELDKIFKELDIQGSGKISRIEIVEATNRILGKRISDIDVNNLIERVDLDKDGYLDYTEFLIAAMDREKILSIENLETAFKRFDTNNSGKISSEELRTLLSSWDEAGKEDWQQVIQEVDQNGDGEVDLMEFKDLMLKCICKK